LLTKEVVMGFTVTRAGGMKDSEFEEYLHLLRIDGVDLGRALRVPEPGTKRRWLSLWDSEAKARTFADQLKQRTAESAWKVVPVNARPSEGPLGPLLILMARRSDELIFCLEPLGKAMLRSAFPDAFGVSFITIDTEKWDEFRKTRGTLADLVRRIAPCLTGLSGEQLQALGYAVVDGRSRETFVSVPPAEVAQV
jgi:hypothetical protein